MEKDLLKGIIGGIIGGIVCSIPWVLVYVFADTLLSVLALVIGIGILKGYQLFKGKVTKHLPLYIYIIAILIVVVETLVVIPSFILIKEGWYGSLLEGLTFLYSLSDFTSGIFRDLAISLVFTLLGVSAVASSVKKQIEADPENTREIVYGGENREDETNRWFIKNYFTNLEATTEENAITIDYSTGLDHQTFIKLQQQGIIKNVDGAYYYSLEDDRRVAQLQRQEEEAKDRRSKNVAKGVGIVLAVCLVITMVFAIVVIFDHDDDPIDPYYPTEFYINNGHFAGINDDFDYMYGEDDDEWYVYYADDEEFWEKGYIAIYCLYDKPDYSKELIDAEIKYYEETWDDVEVEDAYYRSCSGYDGIELVIHISGTNENGKYDYYQITNEIFIEGNKYILDTVCDTYNMARDLLEDSGILNNID